ncbi:exonuclease domain-containing protein [Sphingomonas glacialis]|uniref:Exonuclease domain-containing protein n=1 Tax=Sphingomonas glacialis TaxID=658225 RepID=A0A502FZZ1_9SPHN|nr:exonuclease domain-containing protein [Sphingomonas glacialis]TPG55049.1 hypothetical protein EAH76_10780 [Sphingomonas glacialis]
MRFRVLDLETTGFEPPAEVIELGIADLLGDERGMAIGPPRSWLYRPQHGIPPETKAVHHLTESDFGLLTFPCSPGQLRGSLIEPGVDMLVAHNRYGCY